MLRMDVKTAVRGVFVLMADAGREDKFSVANSKVAKGELIVYIRRNIVKWSCRYRMPA